MDAARQLVRTLYRLCDEINFRISSNWVVNRIRRVFIHHLIRRSRRTFPRITSEVFRISRGKVVKTGHAVYIRHEAEALKFASQHIKTVRIPTLYDFWEISDTEAYLVMQYMPGVTVKRAWPDLSRQQKIDIARTLGELVHEMRHIPQPRCLAGWIASASGGSFLDHRVTTRLKFGPFESESAFNDWRVSLVTAATYKHPPTQLNVMDIRRTMSDSHPIVFTHGDLSQRNVLVDYRPDSDKVRVTAVLDWEQGGWRPQHWEAAKYSYISRRSDAEWSALGYQYIFPGSEEDVEREDKLLAITSIPPN